MPVMSGMKALKEIKRRFPDRNTKIVCITASAFDDQVRQYLEMEFDTFIAKPFKADEIEAQFKSHLKENALGFGQVLLPFRLALTGSGGGPSMFDFAEFLGLEKTLERIDYGIGVIENILLEE